MKKDFTKEETEIELAWLVKYLPDDLDKHRSVKIVQAYTLRMRIPILRIFVSGRKKVFILTQPSISLKIPKKQAIAERKRDKYLKRSFHVY